MIEGIKNRSEYLLLSDIAERNGLFKWHLPLSVNSKAKRHIISRIDLLSLLLTLCSIISCNNDRELGRDDHIIRLPDHFEKGDFSLSEIATEIKFIPLSTEVPLPMIVQIDCFDSLLYLRAFENSELFRFTIEGSYVDVLDNKGRGPGEYRVINDFHVDKAGTVYVNCGTNMKVIVYNSDLSYRTTIPYPADIGHSHVRWLDSIVVFFPENIGEVSKYDWVTTNYEGEILSYKLEPNYGLIQSYRNSYSFLAYKKDSFIYRYRNWSDTIFSISSRGAKARFVYSRKFTDGLRMRALDEILSESMMSLMQLNEAGNPNGKRDINAIYDIGGKLIIAYRGEKRETVLYDMQKNQSRIILDDNNGFARIPNDWLGYGTIQIRNVVEIGSSRYIIDYIDAMRVISMVGSDDFLQGRPTWPEKKAEFKLLGENLDENDNPVIVLIKLK